MSQELLFEISEGVALITLNRPEAHNSMSAAIIEGIGEAYRRCDEDNAIRVVVVTGAGKAFCTGADMTAGADTFDSSAQTVEIDSCPLSMQAWDVRKPVIAACNGHAVGAGLGLAVQADMRVFANEGKYGFLQSRRGVVTDFASCCLAWWASSALSNCWYGHRGSAGKRPWPGAWRGAACRRSRCLIPPWKSRGISPPAVPRCQ